MLGHALPAGEEIAEGAEHGAEIDRHQPGLVLENDILSGDKARAHPADRLAVEAHGLATRGRGGRVAHQPHDRGGSWRAERIAERQRRQHAKGDRRGRKLPRAQQRRGKAEQTAR